MHILERLTRFQGLLERNGMSTHEVTDAKAAANTLLRELERRVDTARKDMRSLRRFLDEFDANVELARGMSSTATLATKHVPTGEQQ